MKILVEEYQYDAALVRDVLQGVDALQNVEGQVSLSYVGYFYNPKLNGGKGDTVFILPKVLMDEQGKVFSKYSPNAIIHMDHENMSDQERKFLYEFAVWIYRAVDVFQRSHKDSDIVYHRKISQVGRGMKKRANTLLDILLSLIQFNKDNQSLITFILKNLHSGFNKINWTRTINHSEAIIQSDEPIYIRPVNKKRQVNFDEELLVIYYSILNYISQTYGFHVDIKVGFPLITGSRFESYLSGRGVVRLRQIKYKYFSDKMLELWNLCYAFFAHRTEITTSTELKEYLLVKNFYVVFEAIIDELIGDSKEELPKDFKEQKDGKLVDHLYTYPGLIEADDEQRTYYIGDSKYYRIGGPLGDTSIYKQYTYARNIVQYNIDLWLDESKPDPDIRLRDDVTEGYNIIPNFFISAAMKPGDYSYNHREIELTKITGKRNPEIKFQFKDRLFDRDTMLLSRYNVNFLFVVSLYARNRQSEKAAWKDEVRKQFRDEIRKVLEWEYSFYPMRSRGVVLDDYMTQHFRQLTGKVFTPFQDKSILTLALHTPNERHALTAEQAELVDMLKEDFDIDENYTLGAEPQLPEATDLQFKIDDYVIIGYYKDEEHLNWILNKKHYNVRSGKDKGSLSLSTSVCAARFLLLYGKKGIYKFALKPNNVRVWDKQDMINDGYKNPRHDFYLVFFIEEHITEGDFANIELDEVKVAILMNKYGKENAGHDKGAVAVKFSELVRCKV
ncbi:MAG: LlaJI family restriction endonuclease [Prevotella sp.]|nr:LlaJI family restriction endonuclease [Prevotella sp.]